jgi:acid phosphatase
MSKPTNLSILFFALLLFLPSVMLAQLPQPDHIVIVIEENHGYNDIIGSSQAPYINSLVDDTLSALFTDSHGVTHPSQPNYLWLFSGDNQGITDDNIPNDTPFTTQNLGALLLNDGKSFAGYSESLPYTGFHGGSSGAYVRKHNPWVNWQDSPTHGIPWNLNKMFSEFPADYNNLPTVSFVIPNMNNDMHDGSISQGDTWLQNHLDGYVQWAKSHQSILILTFDEDDFTSANWIPTIIIGQHVKDGEYDQSVNHLNFLRTIEDMYNLNYAGSSGDSSAIFNCWDNVTPVELTSFTCNTNENIVSLNWVTATETNNKGFEIQKKNVTSDWTSTGFVEGNGTTTNQHTYSFTDNNTIEGIYQYRLKQIDFDGSYSFSKTVEVNLHTPAHFELNQNYPNPFNPSTTISYSVPNASQVVIKIYNVIGKEVSTLVNESKPAGNYQVKLDAKDLPSGIYFYKIQAGNFSDVKKMILLK